MAHRWTARALAGASILVLSQAALAATPADTLVMAKNIDDMISLDPAECYELTGVEVDANIYDRLIRNDPKDATKLVGGVAESWTSSPDGKTMTFKLRPGLTFTDGSLGFTRQHGAKIAPSSPVPPRPDAGGETRRADQGFVLSRPSRREREHQVGGDGWRFQTSALHPRFPQSKWRQGAPVVVFQAHTR